MFRIIQIWWRVVVIKFQVCKIASAAMRESWDKVRTKTAVLTRLQSLEYIGKHSAAIVHRKVELLVRENPNIDSGTANMLIVRASDRLNRQMSRRLTSKSRILRRAA